VEFSQSRLFYVVGVIGRYDRRRAYQMWSISDMKEEKSVKIF